MKLSTRSKGIIAELKVATEAAKRNYFTCSPNSMDAVYDLLIDTGQKILKAQVKYFGEDRKADNKRSVSCYRINLGNSRSTRAFYTSKDIDLLFVYLFKKDVLLCYPSKIFHKRLKLSINLQKKSSPWYWEKHIWK